MSTHATYPANGAFGAAYAIRAPRLDDAIGSTLRAAYGARDALTDPFADLVAALDRLPATFGDR